MPKLPPFHVDQDLCTECGDCIKLLPQAFRKVEDEEVAEVYAELDEDNRPKLDEDHRHFRGYGGDGQHR